MRKIYKKIYLLVLVPCFLFGQVPVQENLNPDEQNFEIDEKLNLPQPGLFSDPMEIELIEGLDDPMERLKIRDHDAHMVLDAIQLITGKYILRRQDLPQVKITFDSMNELTKRETLLALESLLSINGVGVTKIDDQFYKAVPTAGMNTHVPIWLDGSSLSLQPSQRIYIKMFNLQYAHARICSVFRKSKIDEDSLSEADLNLLDSERETEIIKSLGQYPKIIERAANSYEPHLICYFLNCKFFNL